MRCRWQQKVEHATRDSALAHVRELEYKNSLRGDHLESVGLSAYPCRGCGGWPVGRRKVPTVWHYDDVAVLDAMTEDVALFPERRQRLSKRARRRHTGPMLSMLLNFEEHASMTWFTFDAAWDFTGVPHPGTFVVKSASKCEAVVRLGAPASIITLRWHDYVAKNGEARAMAKSISELDRSQWLATDQPLPRSLVRRIDVWHRGAWVDANRVDAEDGDAEAYRVGC